MADPDLEKLREGVNEQENSGPLYVAEPINMGIYVMAGIFLILVFALGWVWAFTILGGLVIAALIFENIGTPDGLIDSWENFLALLVIAFVGVFGISSTVSFMSEGNALVPALVMATGQTFAALFLIMVIFQLLKWAWEQPVITFILFLIISQIFS